MAQTITATDVELQKPINALFEQRFLRRAQQTCPYFTGTQPGTLMKQAGTSTIKWRRIEQLAPSTTALSELTATATFMMGRDSVTPTFTDVLATVAKYGQFYIVNEEVDLFNPNGTSLELVATLGESAGRSLNELMRNIWEGSTTQRYAANVASLAAVHAKLAIGDLARAVNELANQSAKTFTPMTAGSTNIGTVPILESYWAFCHPDVAYDVTQISGFQGVNTYNSQVSVATGEFGYIPGAGRGIRFVQSEDASKTANAGAALSGADLNSTGGTDADTYVVVVTGRDAVGSVGLGMRHTDGTYKAGDKTGGWELINHPRGSSGVADPFNEVGTVGYKTWFAGSVLNSNWARAINVAATNLTN